MRNLYAIAISTSNDVVATLQYIQKLTITNSNEKDNLNTGLSISIGYTKPSDEIDIKDIYNILHFSNKKEAEAILSLIKLKGYKNAFIAEIEITTNVKII